MKILQWIKDLFFVTSIFELYQDKKKEWRFNLIAPNGEKIVHSEGYKTKQGAMNGIKAVRRYAKLSDIIIK